jgi:hypothetical protein
MPEWQRNEIIREALGVLFAKKIKGATFYAVRNDFAGAKIAHAEAGEVLEVWGSV